MGPRCSGWSCSSGGKLETPAIVFLLGFFVYLFVFLIHQTIEAMEYLLVLIYVYVTTIYRLYVAVEEWDVTTPYLISANKQKKQKKKEKYWV